MKRGDCYRALAPFISDEVLVVTNVSGNAFMWNAIKPREGNLLNINLGQCTPLAVGLALALPNRKVVALDGDGNLLLNLGSLCTLAQQCPNNLVVIVLNNRCYESCGNLPSATGLGADLSLFAKAAGIRNAHVVDNIGEFEKVLKESMADNQLHFIDGRIEVGIERGPMVTTDGKEMKYRFVRYIEGLEKKKILYARLSGPSDRAA